MQYLVLEDQLRILVTTPRGITAYRVEADAKAINKAVLTLSACETAIGGANAEGKEIDGMGALAQRKGAKGAKGVLATLWSVADASTGIFMRRLYRLRTEQGLTKAEALRRTQLAFLAGKHDDYRGEGRRGSIVRITPDSDTVEAGPATNYRHPYYWAPFILMGNWL